jgi:hypothetical protein
MRPHHYSFRHTATVPAARDAVADVLLDLEHYPQWWPQVRAVAKLGEDDALVVCRSLLPYDLELHLHAEARTRAHLEVTLDGPLAGFARWELRDEGAGTHLLFTQEVRVTTRALRAASYLLRPLLVGNHAAMMRGCVRGLARRLETR